MNPKMILDLNIKAKTINFLEAMQLRVSQRFLIGHRKEQTIKEKHVKLT